MTFGSISVNEKLVQEFRTNSVSDYHINIPDNAQRKIYILNP